MSDTPEWDEMIIETIGPFVKMAGCLDPKMSAFEVYEAEADFANHPIISEKYHAKADTYVPLTQEEAAKTDKPYCYGAILPSDMFYREIFQEMTREERKQLKADVRAALNARRRS
jgi:thiaminase